MVSSMERVLSISPTHKGIHYRRGNRVTFTRFVRNIFTLNFTMVTIRRTSVSTFRLRFLHRVVGFLHDVCRGRHLRLFRVTRATRRFNAFTHEYLSRTIGHLIRRLTFFYHIRPGQLNVRPLLSILRIFTIHDQGRARLAKAQRFFSRLTRNTRILLLRRVIHFVGSSHLSIIRFRFFLINRFRRSSQYSSRSFQFFLRLISLATSIHTTSSRLHTRILRKAPLHRGITCLIDRLLQERGRRRLRLFINVHFLRRQGNVDRHFAHSYQQ